MTPPLTVAWTIDAGGPVTYPLLADGRVFVTTGGWSLSLQPGSVTALDRTTGTTLWGPLALGNEPLAAYDRGTLFIVNFDGKLIALDGASGQTKWSLQLANPYLLDSPPVAIDGVVYVQGDYLYAVDEETGTILWKTIFYGTEGTVAVQNGTVYEGESCGQASALDAATGGLLWHHSTDCGGGGGSTPTIFDGRLYVRYLPWRYSTWGDQILDATTGSLLGKFASLQPPAFADGVGYYLDDSGTLSAVSVSTGVLAWSFVGDGSLTSAPLVAGSYVYVGSDSGSLYALDNSGQVVWTTSVGGAINSNQEIRPWPPLRGRSWLPSETNSSHSASAGAMDLPSPRRRRRRAGPR